MAYTLSYRDSLLDIEYTLNKPIIKGKIKQISTDSEKYIFYGVYFNLYSNIRFSPEINEKLNRNIIRFIDYMTNIIAQYLYPTYKHENIGFLREIYAFIYIYKLSILQSIFKSLYQISGFNFEIDPSNAHVKCKLIYTVLIKKTIYIF